MACQCFVCEHLGVCARINVCVEYFNRENEGDNLNEENMTMLFSPCFSSLRVDLSLNTSFSVGI